MRFSSVTIDNFRSIHHSEIRLSPFNCVVGQNNCGKSSTLLAISLIVSGTRLNRSDYYDPEQDVVIKVTLEGVTPAMLGLLAPEAADRISELVRGETLTLIRRYDTSGVGKLRCIRKMSKETRFQPSGIDDVVKGRGAVLKASVLETYPELTDKLDTARNQDDFRLLIAGLVSSLKEADFQDVEGPLPTGMDASVLNLFPEVVFIPAVRDATDEVKTKDSSSFGKIIKILLDVIGKSEQVQQIERSFANLNQLMNKTTGPDGVVIDNRIREVAEIEDRVTRYVREQFRDIKLDILIPPPDLKTVFSSARILIDDGVIGEIDTKGDGLKRAVLFSLLRTFVDLRHLQRGPMPATSVKGYLFLFEEPELYLHPGAQRILYDALVDIATDHQVCVCTHSPYFFSATSSGTFLRLKKVQHHQGATAPVTDSLQIDLIDNISSRDAFQIICYENNSVAFFCDRVVLVEGDCDVIFLKHIARMINPRWNFDRYNVAMIKIGGKGSFSRYREFYNSFNVDVRMIADLDALVDQYGKLGAPATCDSLRSTLIAAADIILDAQPLPSVKTEKLKSLTNKRSFRERYDHCKSVAQTIAAGQSPAKDDLLAFGELFAAEHDYHRQRILASDATLARHKEALLAELRKSGVMVLSKGCIEDYYPDGCEGQDKPSRALTACAKVTDATAALACCSQIWDGNGGQRAELELIFENVFAGL